MARPLATLRRSVRPTRTLLRSVANGITALGTQPRRMHMAGRTSLTSEGQRFLLSGLDYHRYVAIADAIGEQPIRLTYCRGSLELSTPSFKHERLRHILSRLVMTVAEETEIDTGAGGSMTMRRENLDCAI